MTASEVDRLRFALASAREHIEAVATNSPGWNIEDQLLDKRFDSWAAEARCPDCADVYVPNCKACGGDGLYWPRVLVEAEALAHERGKALAAAEAKIARALSCIDPGWAKRNPRMTAKLRAALADPEPKP